MLAVVLYWAFNQGGYESRPTLGAAYQPDASYLGGLVLVGLWCATALGLRRIRLARLPAIACAALFAYTAWSFLSVQASRVEQENAVDGVRIRLVAGGGTGL
jgi:ABC-type transport system involved in cytochrome c biogenesis permease subunit